MSETSFIATAHKKWEGVNIYLFVIM